jgi:hypothetical protein
MIQDQVLVLDNINNIVVETHTRNNFRHKDNKGIVKEGKIEEDIS